MVRVMLTKTHYITTGRQSTLLAVQETSPPQNEVFGQCFEFNLLPCLNHNRHFYFPF